MVVYRYHLCVHSRCFSTPSISWRQNWMVAKRTIFFKFSKLGLRRVNLVGMNMYYEYKVLQTRVFCFDGGDHIDHHNAYDTDDEAFCATLLLPVHA